MDWFLYDIRLRHERVKSHVFHFRLFSAKTKKRQYLVIFNTSLGFRYWSLHGEFSGCEKNYGEFNSCAVFLKQTFFCSFPLRKLLLNFIK